MIAYDIITTMISHVNQGTSTCRVTSLIFRHPAQVSLLAFKKLDRSDTRLQESINIEILKIQQQAEMRDECVAWSEFL